MTVTPWGGGTAVLTKDLTTSANLSGTDSTLTAGYYKVTCQMTNPSKSLDPWVEALHIYQNMESKFEKEFKPDYFLVYVDSITISPTSPTVIKGGATQTLTATVKALNDPAETPTDKTVKWSIDDTSVATVDEDLGVVTAVGSGSAKTATITATANDAGKKSATCTVTVFVPVTGITLTSSTSVDVSTPLTLAATVAPTNADNQSPIVWSVKPGDTTGASISGSTFTATTAGTATIIATIANGKTPAPSGTDYTEEFDIEVNSSTPGASIEIKFGISDATTSTNLDSDFILSKTGAGTLDTSAILSVSGTGVTYKWFVNNSQVGTDDTSHTLDVSTSTYPIGSYVLRVEVMVSGVPYTKTVHFKVVP
jgi:uncharacterized protein YjdB